MINVSAKTEYACLAIFDLALAYASGEPQQLRRIAEAHDIPSNFLAQILSQLKTAGVVTSTRGASGGYRLAIPPEEITMWDIVCVMEGEAKSNGCPSRGAVAILSDTWQRAADQSREALQAISFAELVEQAGNDAHSMYYI